MTQEDVMTKREMAEYVVELARNDFVPYPIRSALWKGEFDYAAQLLAAQGEEVPDWLAESTPSSLGLALAFLTMEGAPDDAHDLVVGEVSGSHFADLGTVPDDDLAADLDGADKLLDAHGWERLSSWEAGADFTAWVWKDEEVG